MLPQTFCHIEGIGPTTEQRLWREGICTWHDALETPITMKRIGRQTVTDAIEASLAALADNPRFFTDRLKRFEAWRIFPHFRNDTAYLDIETSGISHSADITTIALYDGTSVKTYVNGRNLDAFPEDLETYKVLVTYSGLAFDIPMIERFFRIKLTQAQIDLRYVLARLGCRGGLKGCERQLGISRGLLDGVDGACAVALWREYEWSGNESALETLLAYNIEDTVNLERLLVEAYNRNLDRTPFGSSQQIPFPVPPPLLHHPDPLLVDWLAERQR